MVFLGPGLTEASVDGRRLRAPPEGRRPPLMMALPGLGVVVGLLTLAALVYTIYLLNLGLQNTMQSPSTRSAVAPAPAQQTCCPCNSSVFLPAQDHGDHHGYDHGDERHGHAWPPAWS